MTPLERAAQAIFDMRRSQPPCMAYPAITGEWDAQFRSVKERYANEARAVLQAAREPIDEWLAYQIEHGHAPDGYPVEMTAEYAMGRRAAFQATQAMIDAALEEG